jgi:hypothetical protein
MARVVEVLLTWWGALVGVTMLLGQRSNRNGCGVTEWRVQGAVRFLWEVWKADLREKREALTFLLVLVAGLSCDNWHRWGLFWWGLRRLSLALPLATRAFSSYSSCDNPIYCSNSDFCPSTPQVLSLLLPSDVLNITCEGCLPRSYHPWTRQ